MENKPKSVSCFRLFRYSSCSDKVLLVFGILFAILAATSLPIFIILFSYLTNRFVDYAIDSTSNGTLRIRKFDIDEFVKDVHVFGIEVFFLGLAQLLFCYLMIICICTSAKSQGYRVRTLYFKSLLHQDMAWFDTYEGDFVTQVGESLVKLEEGIGLKLALFIYLICQSIFTLIIALYHGWLLTLVVLLTTLVLMFFTIIISVVQSRFGENELVAYSEATTLAEESLAAVRTVVAFGGEEKVVEWYEDKLTESQSSAMYKGFFTALSSGIGWALTFSGYSLAFWYGIRLIIKSRENGTDEYTPTVLLIVFLCALMTGILFGHAVGYFREVHAAKLAAGPIYQIIRRVAKINSRSRYGLDPKILFGVIEFRNVYFSYPARPEVPVLQGINLTFNRGETVAIVGSSGCGKSTILQLILRMYDVDEGEVVVDGKNVKLYNVCSLRTKIGYVDQEPMLFGFSIQKNIALAKERKVSKSEVEKAAIAVAANAHDFITKLPKKYKTKVGDKRTQLSGGQKQRIAIARALIKSPAILLLDEATSALDNQSEAAVFSAIEETKQNRTTIIVAHRLSSMKHADRIIVLDQGKVVEIGDHNSLLAKQGMYYNLIRPQIWLFDSVFKKKKKDVDHEAEWEKMSMFLKGLRKPSFPTDDKSISEESVSSSPVFLRILALNKPQWWLLLIGCIAAIGFGISIPMFSFVFGSIMAVFVITDPDEAREEANKYAIYFLVVAFWAGVCSFCQVLTFTISGEYLIVKLRTMMLTAIFRQEMAYFDNPYNSAGALSARLSLDITNIQGATGAIIGLFIQAIAALAIAFVISLILVWEQALVSFILIPFICVGSYLEAKFTAGELLKEMEAQDNAAKVAVEAISNIRTVAALCKAEMFYEEYVDSLESIDRKITLKFHLRGILFGFSQSIQFCWSYGLSLWFGGYLIKNAGYDYTDVLKVSELIIFSSVFVGQTLVFAPNCQKGAVSARRIFTVLDREPKFETAEEELAEFEPPDNSRVEFAHVSFAYPMRAVRVLREFNCVVESGKTVALVGSSGSGKTTCIQLLERFYDADSGFVKIAGEDVKSYDIKWLRSQLGLVSQEPVLFDRSVAENIAFGDNTRAISRHEIIDVAKKANIHAFVVNLPEGYDTNVGRQGAQLSGGQKQRIAIARALVRNPKILLLDEATSTLDAESEKVVQAALDEAMADRTCIMIAHRLVTVQNADKIVVMHLGRVVEQGTHQELMNKRGVYYQMVLMSNMQYQG